MDQVRPVSNLISHATSIGVRPERDAGTITRLSRNLIVVEWLQLVGSGAPRLCAKLRRLPVDRLFFAGFIGTTRFFLLVPETLPLFLRVQETYTAGYPSHL